MKKNETGITKVEFLFRTEHMHIIEAICKEFKLECKWIDIKIGHPFQQCHIFMPIIEKASIEKIINTTLTKAYEKNANIIRPDNEILN